MPLNLKENWLLNELPSGMKRLEIIGRVTAIAA
jgi:hypothetical protein